MVGYTKLWWVVDKMLTIAFRETAVKKDVEYLKQNKGIPDSIKISGWVYQVEDGKVKHIV